MVDRVRYFPGSNPTHAYQVTPSNDDDLPVPTEGIYVSAVGDVSGVLVGDELVDDVTFTDLAAGVFHPLRFRRILATGTDAITIVALY